MRWDDFQRRRDMAMRHGMAPGMPSGGTFFAELEQIDNGMLVHYRAPVRVQVPGIPFPSPPGVVDGDAWKRPEDSGHVLDLVEPRTVYCKDLAEVNKAVEAAHAAYREILGLSHRLSAGEL